MKFLDVHFHNSFTISYFYFPVTMVMCRFLCCFINCAKIKPSSPPQVAETGKKVPPSPLPPKGAEMAKRQPPPKFKGIPVKDGGYVVSKSNKTTAKSTRRRSRYGNDAGGFGGCGGGCGGGGGC
ncbi:hypothetical protein CARUB_v10010658mg [Capsella rubella]|uniref:Uncharacterized protein n=1 Tax=Capsella rubella TaxID=81985 RepID=R0GN51_9BRAS|nr:hypothetical protein CARUB_v10010658mg [Capsella rubella]